MDLSVAEIIEAAHGSLVEGRADARCTSYHTDSRAVEPGGCFFALRGASLDGHAFCAGAAARGAVVLVVERDVAGHGAAVVRVADTWRALYDLAGHVLARVAPLVVGVTGSNGKTSTKELTAAVLGARFDLLRGLSRAPIVGFGLEAGDLRGEGYRPLPGGGAVVTVEGAPVRL